MSTSISFVIATRNRLPLLKITLSKLWENIRPQDEICIVDGNSSDGTVAFAQQLLAEGKIGTDKPTEDIKLFNDLALFKKNITEFMDTLNKME